MKRIRQITRKFHLLFISFLFLGQPFSQTGPGGVGGTTSNQVWLDAHALGFADGTPVSTWNDISGNLSNFTQGASIQQPLYNSTGISSIPSLTFDGINDILVSSSIPALESTNVTYFIVYDRTTTTSDIIITSNYDSNFKKWRTYMNNGQNTLISAHYSPSIKWVRYTDPPGSSFFSTHISPTNIRTYNQGSLAMSKSATYTVPTGHNSIYLGNRDPLTVSSYTFTGEISELIIYSTSLNDLERIMVENYLGAKYQMAIPSDYYDYQATHRFGLVGIGNDGTNTQVTAQGAGILELSNALDLGTNEYYLTAHTDFVPDVYNTVDVPTTLPEHQRLERTWRLDETGELDVVTLTFKLGVYDFATSDSYRLLVDTDGTFIDAAIYSGTYAAGSVSFDVNLADGDYFTLAGIQNILEIHSVIDGPWSEVATWDCECIPSINDLVYIDPATTVDVDIDAYTNTLDIEFGGTLEMSTASILSITGDWYTGGTATFTNGTLALIGSESQDISISTTALSSVALNDVIVSNSSAGDVTFIDGVFSLGGTLSPNLGNIVMDPSTEFRVNSTSASAGGRIGPIISPSTITGKVSVERFIPAGVADWRDLCSPVLGLTFNNWDEDLAMSGPDFPDGCAWGLEGCFHSVTFTDHSIQYDVLDSSDPITNGRGYEMFIGTTLITYDGGTITSTGILNNSEDVVETFTTGWTIVGNPYASPIAFSTLTMTSSIGNYFYVYDPASGSYEWYDGTSGTSSLVEITEDGLIATGQAVWIFATSAGSITFNQFNKTESNATYIRSFEEDNSLHLTLSENSSTYSCTMRLTEIDGAEDGMDESIDIRHLSTGQELSPSIAVQSGEDVLRMNYIKNDGREKSFELSTKILNDGFYTISAENWGNFRDYQKILLFDHFTGETVNLKENTYAFYSVADDPEIETALRFTLILSNSENASNNNGIHTTSITKNDQLSLKQMGNSIDIQSLQNYDEISTISLTNALGQKEVFQTTTSLVTGSNIITLPEDLKGFHIITIKTGESIINQKIILY